MIAVALPACLTGTFVRGYGGGVSKIWGHEHRCVLYRPYANVHYGRCIGHGSLPVYMWHK